MAMDAAIAYTWTIVHCRATPRESLSDIPQRPPPRHSFLALLSRRRLPCRTCHVRKSKYGVRHDISTEHSSESAR